MLSTVVSNDNPYQQLFAEPSSAAAQSRVLRWALGISLLVHLALLYSLIDARLGRSPAELDTVLELSLSQPVPPEQQEPQELQEAPVEIVESVPVQTVVTGPEPLPAEAPPAEAAEPPPNSSAAPAAEIADEIQDTPPAIDPVQLQRSIATAISRHSQDLTASWIADCEGVSSDARYRARQPDGSCSQSELYQPNAEQHEQIGEIFSSTVNSDYYEKVEIKALRQEITSLEQMMDDNPVLASIARDRYTKARARLWELEPPGAEVIPLISFSLASPSLSLLGGRLGINLLEGTIEMNGEQVLDLTPERREAEEAAQD